MTLHVRDLDVGYGSVRAVRGATLTVGEGEAVALIGSNGAGKSTLLKAISGMLACDSGSVWFAGEDVTACPSHVIAGKGIAHVPEGRRLFPRMTVRENLLLGAFRRRDGHVAKDLVTQLDLFPRLGERLEQEAGTLSGGEQQMVAIARALMSRPALLLLDEPGLGLSPLMASAVFAAISEIHRAGTALLLVEQNATKALAITSRGYVMTTGEILRDGASTDLRDDPTVREIYLGGAPETRLTPVPGPRAAVQSEEVHDERRPR
ncbi:ABC transporter ATP-binding protein [Nonomuraea lactucae]|uniref:ABC transporter ATP-binding protein n=1 Tax=Nonomuraea lactucae TaxID=2249762 RepID=UPI000DE423E1|nr:ABC transporter ATP-binding protein [Nonomuraea lactucae]